MGSKKYIINETSNVKYSALLENNQVLVINKFAKLFNQDVFNITFYANKDNDKSIAELNKFSFLGHNLLEEIFLNKSNHPELADFILNKILAKSKVFANLYERYSKEITTKLSNLSVSKVVKGLMKIKVKEEIKEKSKSDNKSTSKDSWNY